MLEDKCRDAIRRYSMISPGGSVVVGLSGGADSCALLHFLFALRDEWELRMAAVHVNHLIRGEEAERDAAFAEAKAQSGFSYRTALLCFLMLNLLLGCASDRFGAIINIGIAVFN